MHDTKVAIMSTTLDKIRRLVGKARHKTPSTIRGGAIKKQPYKIQDHCPKFRAEEGILARNLDKKRRDKYEIKQCREKI